MKKKFLVLLLSTSLLLPVQIQATNSESIESTIESEETFIDIEEKPDLFSTLSEEDIDSTYSTLIDAEEDEEEIDIENNVLEENKELLASKITETASLITSSVEDTMLEEAEEIEEAEEVEEIEKVTKDKIKSRSAAPEVQTEPITGTLIINKTLYCHVWHTECDVMGDQYWVKDEISNPQGIKSKEGHRIDHCGAKDSWYVYLNEYGDPYAMMEMKAGSTNDLIPLPAHFYTDETYTEVRDPATIEVGERIYWTTENKGQVWHHTGVTRLDIPNFEFIIDNQSYTLSPGESLTIDLPEGQHEIIEKYDKEYIINDVNVPFTVNQEGSAIITVTT